MKRILSLLIAAMLLLGMVPAMAESAVEYIPAPYTVADLESANDAYFPPVVYENENGPSIGVTMVGVLKVDGLYFKDSNNNQQLDAFEDWRLPSAERAEALVLTLTNHQKAAFIFNNLYMNPVGKTLTAITKEDGSIDPAQLITVYTPAEGETVGTIPGAPAGMVMSGFSLPNDNDILVLGLRHAVYRGSLGYDASVVSAMNNLANQYAETAAVLNGETFLPFTLISNPISAGHVNNMALSAAVMGDVVNGEGYKMVETYAELDRQMWVSVGLRQMYGPQIDLSTDPRWARNSGTYGEVPEVVAGITTALVSGYQQGTDGVQLEGVSLSIKHFPGDGAAENGYESHTYQGQWRIYTTPGSLEKYQLPGFQAACDAGVSSIMPCYSRDTTDPRSAEQSYRGVVIPVDQVGSAYSETMMQTLLIGAMGFKGFINTDSGILSTQTFGVETLTMPERYAKLINNGVGAIGAGFEYYHVETALADGLITEEQLNAVVVSRLAIEINQGRLDNPYTDNAEADVIRAANTTGEAAAEIIYTSQLKSVVLLKNKGNVLPLNDTTKTVYIASFTGKGEDEKVLASLTAEFEARGFTVVDDEDEADIIYIDVAPTYNGTTGSNTAMGVIDLVAEAEVPAVHTKALRRDGVTQATQIPTGELIEVTTVEDVDEIAELAEGAHERGAIVIAAIKVTQPWILTNLEPHVDGLIAQFGVPEKAQIAVVTGEYNPTGKLPITMVSCYDVIATNWEYLEDGRIYEICVSPNDVPGYDKDQYIDPAILENVPGGSYAYCDSEGNYYKAWFGLSY
ncbi:MAG: glycoside hydrolase family 3 C-terminal domain-containing protein [Clostridia bacterium]|nr:glycoside hydrolase family 3 C-terminal domain-containing protein [Clostridia bacterium]